MKVSNTISIVTVCYNSASTLQKTIDSVIGQLGVAVEHIIIDGGSHDGTVQIIKDNIAHITYWVSEPDSGVYEAMNKGLAKATGDIVGFLNSDDVYPHANVLGLVANRMRERALDALYGNVEFFHPSDRTRVVRTYESGRFSPARLGWGWMPAHPALFLHRDVFGRYGCFREDYRIGGDFEFVARVFSDGKLQYEHYPRVFVKMQTGGLSTAGLRATYRLNAEVLRACRENGIKSNWMMLLSKYFHKIREISWK